MHPTGGDQRCLPKRTVAVDRPQGKNVVNDIASVYGKDKENFFVKEIEAGRLRYLDKEKSRKWAQSAGLYLPGEATLLAASDKTILSEEDLVNTLPPRVVIGGPNYGAACSGGAVDGNREHPGINVRLFNAKLGLFVTD